jgi:predicted DNA binding CopG/RHH family protein
MTELQYLDEEERTIIGAIENDPRGGAALDAREEAHMRETLARASRRQRKDAKITLRLPAGDLLAIKAKARRLGVEYQPLIAELIHQYAAGELRRTD